MKRLVSIGMAVIFCFLPFACASAAEPAQGSGQLYFTADELKGKRVGVMIGFGADVTVTDLGIFDIHRYLSDTDLPIALKAGNLDAFAVERTEAELMVREIPGLAILPDVIGPENYVAIFPKHNKALRDEVDAAIGEIVEAPVYEEMKARWLPNDLESAEMPDIPAGTGEKLVVAISSDYVPFEYFGEGGERLGFEVELCLRIGAALDREIAFFETAYSALLPALESGYADMCISALDDKPALHDRYQVSRRYFNNEIVLLVAAGRNTDNDAGILEGIWQSFNKHLIVENRFLYILEGLGNTLVISMIAASLGTLLGALFCAMSRGGRRALRAAAELYVRILQGTPIIVLLLIIAYVVFAGSGADTVLVGGIAFSLHFSAKATQVFSTGLGTVDPGQVEAAKAMGLSGLQTYRLILIPQATVTALPIYCADLLEMVKLTSVVGYVGVMDLTYAVEIIRTRTYESVFPLLLETVLYILLTSLLAGLFRIAAARIDPRKKERRIRL